MNVKTADADALVEVTFLVSLPAPNEVFVNEPGEEVTEVIVIVLDIDVVAVAFFEVSPSFTAVITTVSVP